MSCVALSPGVSLVAKIQWFKKGTSDVEQTEGITTTLGMLPYLEHRIHIFELHSPRYET